MLEESSERDEDQLPGSYYQHTESSGYLGESYKVRENSYHSLYYNFSSCHRFSTRGKQYVHAYTAFLHTVDGSYIYLQISNIACRYVHVATSVEITILAHGNHYSN